MAVPFLSQIEQGYVFSDRRGRRGRKRKAEKMADQLMAEALAKREQARMLASLDPGECAVLIWFVSLVMYGVRRPCTQETETWVGDCCNFTEFP